MDNKTFNDWIITWAVRRIVALGYESTISDASYQIENSRTALTFIPKNRSFAEQGSIHTLERLCNHAYEIISQRNIGVEVELSLHVKRYYLPRFERLADGKEFY